MSAWMSGLVRVVPVTTSDLVTEIISTNGKTATVSGSENGFDFLPRQPRQGVNIGVVYLYIICICKCRIIRDRRYENVVAIQIVGNRGFGFSRPLYRVRSCFCMTWLWRSRRQAVLENFFRHADRRGRASYVRAHNSPFVAACQYAHTAALWKCFFQEIATIYFL